MGWGWGLTRPGDWLGPRRKGRGVTSQRGPGLRELKRQEATFNKLIRCHNVFKKKERKEKARGRFSLEPLEGPGPGHLGPGPCGSDCRPQIVAL